MLGNEMVFGRPDNLPLVWIDSRILKSQNRKNGSYKLEGKYDTSSNEKV